MPSPCSKAFCGSPLSPESGSGPPPGTQTPTCLALQLCLPLMP